MLVRLLVVCICDDAQNAGFVCKSLVTSLWPLRACTGCVSHAPNIEVLHREPTKDANEKDASSKAVQPWSGSRLPKFIVCMAKPYQPSSQVFTPDERPGLEIVSPYT